MNVKTLKIIAFVLAVVLTVGCLAACGNKAENPADSSAPVSSGSASGESSAESGEITPNEDPIPLSSKKPAFSVSDSTLTMDEMLKTYRGYTNYRIKQIKETKSAIKPEKGGRAFYFSSIHGNDNNNGLSESKPIKSISKIETIGLKPGDVVYLERGSIWRTPFVAPSSHIKYTAYGSGAKPQLYASPANYANESLWKQTDAKNIYCISNVGNADIGAVIFNNGEKCGVKCTIRTEASGTYNHTTGERYNSYKDLTGNLHFYHDRSTGKLYLRCNEGNPGKIFKDIEMNIKQNIITVAGEYNTFDNICFKYTGAHGIKAMNHDNSDGLTVQNCEFYWIGGSILSDSFLGRNYPTRYGNGVEIYGDAHKYTVNNCYFYEIYDTAVTFQSDTAPGNTHVEMQDIKVTNNVMEYCTWGVEYFLDGGDDADCFLENVSIDNNLMWYAGFGALPEQRTDIRAEGHIKGWTTSDNNCKGNFTITNNLFAMGISTIIQVGAERTSDLPRFSGNTYIQSTTRQLGYSIKNGDPMRRGSFTNVRDYIVSNFFDKKAQIVYVKE